MAIINAIGEKTRREQRFLAAIQGIDMDEGRVDPGIEKFEEMKKKVFGKNAYDENTITVTAPNGQSFALDKELGHTVADEDFSWSSI